MTILVQFILYKEVRVKALLRDLSEYNNFNLNIHPPQIGDVGYLIDILHIDGYPDRFIVEKSEPSTGVDIWLSEFVYEEIEPVIK